MVSTESKGNLKERDEERQEGGGKLEMMERVTYCAHSWRERINC